MSDWHDEMMEPMHDTPADKDPLIAAMEAAGYTYDGLESTNDHLRFFWRRWSDHHYGWMA